MKTAALLALLAVAAFAQPKLSLVPLPVTGTTISVNLVLSGSTGQNLAGVQWSLPISPTLSNGSTLSVSAGPASTSAQKDVTCRTSLSSITCVSISTTAASLNANAMQDGIVATLVIQGGPGIYTASLTNVMGTSTLGTAMPVIADIPVNLSLLSPCDLTADGKTDVNDVVFVLNQAVGVNPFTAAADLDADGKVTVNDVMRIVLAALGGVCKVGP